jgi:hypothetical protein
MKKGGNLVYSNLKKMLVRKQLFIVCLMIAVDP